MSAMPKKDAAQKGRMEEMSGQMRNRSHVDRAAHKDARIAPDMHSGAVRTIAAGSTNNSCEGDLAIGTAVDFFTGIGLVVDQIDDDVRNDLPKLLTRVVTAHRARDPIALKLACEAYGKHLRNMQGIADLVARLSMNHANRRPRA